MRSRLLDNLHVRWCQNILNGCWLGTRQSRIVRSCWWRHKLCCLWRIVVQILKLKGWQNLCGLWRAMINRIRISSKINRLPFHVLACEIWLNGILDLARITLNNDGAKLCCAAEDCIRFDEMYVWIEGDQFGSFLYLKCLLLLLLMLWSFVMFRCWYPGLFVRLNRRSAENFDEI